MPYFEGEELVAAAYRWVALPAVAEHPAGVAIDVPPVRGVTPLT